MRCDHLIVRWFLLIVVAIACSGQSDGEPVRAVQFAHIGIPPEHLSEGIKRDRKTGDVIERYEYGGDIRIGDLDGDRVVDFVLAKSVGGLKVCYLGAFGWDGQPLWSWGSKGRSVADAANAERVHRAESPARPGPVLVVDIDGDGATEVVTMVLPDEVRRTHLWKAEDLSFLILDGATGEIERRASPPALRKANAFDDQGRRHEPNYVHQRLLAADFRGTGGPHDFVIKIGNTVLACSDKLEPLWAYENRFDHYGEHSSYIPCVGDVDRDGRDEVFGGNYLLDDDGEVIWEKMMAKHNDSVAIVEWDGNRRNGRELVMSGFGQVARAGGEVIVRLGKEAVPHGQEVRCGPFRPDCPGWQMAVRYRGHSRDVLLADMSGDILTRFKVDASPINVGMETVWWNGRGEPPLLFSPSALWDGRGRKVVEISELPAPSARGRMGWFHCIPADLDGSGREAVVLYDPYADEVFVYGATLLPADPPAGYRHTARQYNVRLMD